MIPMRTKGIRGATTASENSVEAIKNATKELLNTLILKNKIEISNISHVIFTMTSDLNKIFPAKVARETLGWNEVAMMCFNEMDIENSLEKCIRVLIVLNCQENFEPKHIYLQGAKALRPDIN